MKALFGLFIGFPTPLLDQLLLLMLVVLLLLMLDLLELLLLGMALNYSIGLVVLLALHAGGSPAPWPRSASVSTIESKGCESTLATVSQS